MPRRSSAAVATSREGHRSRGSGRDSANYRASSVLASRPGSCDRRHKLGFEEPIIFWTQREAPLL